ncbi:MAG: hypothetical protein IT426_13695 [Pirellulales bacterium]|nr:hypothetical protein [Pirellulales bacterium]
MTRPLDSKRPAPVLSDLGPIRIDELYPLQILGKRLGLGKKSLIVAQRRGLKTVKFSHRKYATGQAILEWFGSLANKQDGEGNEQ